MRREDDAGQDFGRGFAILAFFLLLLDLAAAAAVVDLPTLTLPAAADAAFLPSFFGLLVDADFTIVGDDFGSIRGYI